jgi:hypothetical protein
MSISFFHLGPQNLSWFSFFFLNLFIFHFYLPTLILLDTGLCILFQFTFYEVISILWLEKRVLQVDHVEQGMFLLFVINFLSTSLLNIGLTVN